MEKEQRAAKAAAKKAEKTAAAAAKKRAEKESKAAEKRTRDEHERTHEHEQAELEAPLSKIRPAVRNGSITSKSWVAQLLQTNDIHTQIKHFNRPHTVECRIQVCTRSIRTGLRAIPIVSVLCRIIV